MHFIILTFLIGTAVNAHNAGAETALDFYHSAKQQIQTPEISAADYSKLNQ